MQRRRQQRNRIIAGAGVGVSVVVLLLLATVGGGSNSKAKAKSPSTTAPDNSTPAASIAPVPEGAKITGDTPCPKADGTSPRTTSFAKPPPMCIDANKHY